VTADQQQRSQRRAKVFRRRRGLMEGESMGVAIVVLLLLFVAAHDAWLARLREGPAVVYFFTRENLYRATFSRQG
jgi:hypothetical protein